MAADAVDTGVPVGPAAPAGSAGDEDMNEDDDLGAGRRAARMVAMTAMLAGGGVAGRVALQGVPSVEPLVPLAIATGFYVSWRHGAAVGMSGFYASNFLVWGGHGPWTVFQCLGAGMAAVAGALFARMGDGRRVFVGSLVAGTLLYEVAVNLGSVVTTPWMLAAGVAGMVAALPYAAVHIGSSLGFGGVFYGLRTYIERGYGQHH